MKINERIHNAETDEILEIQRDETALEKKERELVIAEQQALAVAKQEFEAARAAAKAKLEALGLTTDDLKALGL